MAVMVAVGPMSVLWMTVIAAIIVSQKLLRASAAIDVPVAVAVVAPGVMLLVAPWAVPGITPAM
jgi:hypothetical protein